MKDRINTSPESSSDWSDCISDYVHELVIGTSEFEAMNDFYNLQNLYRETRKDRLIGTDSVNGKANLTPEERKDLSLKRIALLEHTIEQKGGQIPGYANAYLEIRDSFDSLVHAASNEAKGIFSDDDAKQTEYIQNTFGSTLNYLLQSIVEKQNPNLIG